MLRLSGTAERRETGHDRILALVDQVDFSALSRLLSDQTLLPLIGTRLLQVASDGLPQSFREQVRLEVERGRHRATLFEKVTLRLVSELERAGIAAVPLKGPLLAQEIHGDAGLRPSSDIDLLVDRSLLEAAIGVLEQNGYAPPNDPPWVEGLPHLHYRLPPREPYVPPIDLHWRIHWYEARFSLLLVGRSSPDPDRGRRPTCADELAALLLFFSRDGLLGLRFAADIAAWWDKHEGALEPVPLDPLLEGHPELRGALVTAGAVANRLVGVPTNRMMSLRWRQNWRSLRAARLANWNQTGENTEIVANLVLIDWLLSPKGGQRAFVRRNLFQPLAHVSQTAELPSNARVRVVIKCTLRGAASTSRFVFRSTRALWRIRGNRDWAPLPQCKTLTSTSG